MTELRSVLDSDIAHGYMSSNGYVEAQPQVWDQLDARLAYISGTAGLPVYASVMLLAVDMTRGFKNPRPLDSGCVPDACLSLPSGVFTHLAMVGPSEAAVSQIGLARHMAQVLGMYPCWRPEMDISARAAVMIGHLFHGIADFGESASSTDGEAHLTYFMGDYIRAVGAPRVLRMVEENPGMVEWPVPWRAVALRSLIDELEKSVPVSQLRLMLNLLAAG
jgi:hypothetical protein